LSKKDSQKKITKNDLNIDFFSDKISYLIYGKYGINGYFIFFILSFLPFYLASIYEGCFFKIDVAKELGVNSVPLIMDLGVHFHLIFLCLLGILVYNFFKNLDQNFKDLWNNGVFKSSEIQDYKDYIKNNMQRANDNESLYKIGIIFAFILLLFELYEQPITDVIFASNSPYYPITKYFLVANGVLWAFLFGIFMWKIYVLIGMMRYVCDEKCILGLKILGPGSIPSLYPLGDIMFKLSRVIVLFLYLPINFTLYAFYWQPDVFSMFLTRATLLLFLFLIFSLSIFIYPIWPVHSYMKSQKKIRINKASSNYKNISMLVFNGTSDPLTSVDKDIRDEFLGAKEIYSAVSKMQEWPFKHNFFSESMKSIFIPFILIVIRIFLSNYVFR